MHCLKFKYPTIILFIISFVYSKEIYINEVYIDEKANGILLELKLDSEIEEDAISSWQANSGWFYITLYKVKGDTFNILKNELPIDVIEFQAIQGTESFQLGLRLRRPIEHYEFLSSNNNIIIGSLYYSREYLAHLEPLKTKIYIEKKNGMQRGMKKWLYLTGSGLTLSGIIREDRKEKIHIHTKIGTVILAFTFIIDSIWRMI